MKIAQRQIEELIEKLEAYLSGSVTHDTISSYAWALSDQSPQKPEESEKVYWSTIFGIIHLADAEHWKDGCTQRDLGELCNKLKQTKA